ncbi:MAG: VWA domain-containing protein [Candidatus Thorarchaeota archaeon]|nr:VWA domain-containing protein [Candidatus Thorarchaeota archaeon]
MPILKSSSEAFPASRKVMSDIPYVLRVEFRDLARETHKIVGKPIACHKCNGFLMSADQIQHDPKVGKHFVCPFCGTLNVIEGEIVIAGNETEFVVQPPPEKTTSRGQVAPAGGSFLAVIDVSGSMAGANLAAVKRSLTTSIESLAANSPETLFGLVEFESSVAVRNLETGERVEVPCETFANLDQIMEATKRLLDRVRLIKVGPNLSGLKRHVSSLREMGGTALGPAVAVAYVIAKHRNIARVVLLTDGLANEGIGALEGYQVTPAGSYYATLGTMFRELGTAFDVVGIASGAGMELKTLGLLPEATGGQMYYVTPNELDRSLSELAGASLLGRDVEIRLLTPKGVRVKDASGVSRAAIEEITKTGSGRIGAVGEDHELYVEVEPESEIRSAQVPVQVQVTYTDEEGARRVRAVSTNLRVTSDERDLVATLDPTMSATFVTQKAGEDAFGGKRAAGADRIAGFRAALAKKTKAAPKAVQARMKRADDALASEEANLQEMESKMAAAPAQGGAPCAAADEAFTRGFKQMKRSSKELFDEKEDE